MKLVMMVLRDGMGMRDKLLIKSIGENSIIIATGDSIHVSLLTASQRRFSLFLFLSLSHLIAPRLVFIQHSLNCTVVATKGGTSYSPVSIE